MLYRLVSSCTCTRYNTGTLLSRFLLLYQVRVRVFETTHFSVTKMGRCICTKLSFLSAACSARASFMGVRTCDTVCTVWTSGVHSPPRGSHFRLAVASGQANHGLPQRDPSGARSSEAKKIANLSNQKEKKIGFWCDLLTSRVLCLMGG